MKLTSRSPLSIFLLLILFVCLAGMVYNYSREARQSQLQCEIEEQHLAAQLAHCGPPGELSDSDRRLWQQLAKTPCEFDQEESTGKDEPLVLAPPHSRIVYARLQGGRHILDETFIVLACRDQDTGELSPKFQMYRAGAMISEALCLDVPSGKLFSRSYPTYRFPNEKWKLVSSEESKQKGAPWYLQAMGEVRILAARQQ